MDRKYFDRKWKITVTSKNGTQWVVSDSEFDTPLKCTFKIEKQMFALGFSCLLTIYNLNSLTMANVIEEGSEVTVEAGYQKQPYGLIFKGQVFQPIFERENVTDFKVILNCIDGLGVFDHNIINLTLASGYDYKKMISKMALSTRAKIPLGGITENLDKKKFPRGKAFFGDV